MVTQLFLAFDDLRQNPEETLEDMLALSESGEPFCIKFNLDAMFPLGIELKVIVDRLKSFGRPLFADLKMWNGSRTMEAVVKTFVSLGVDFVNVYAQADKELEKAVKATEGSKTKILGLTILSHYDDAYCQKWYRRGAWEAVADFSGYAVEAGCHGIILPGTLLGAARHLQTIKVATGLRSTWYEDGRHKQEATPAEVAQAGANFAVCGSPILKQATAAEKISALRRILQEMQAGI